jgi:hypothetical protein
MLFIIDECNFNYKLINNFNYVFLLWPEKLFGLLCLALNHSDKRKIYIEKIGLLPVDNITSVYIFFCKQNCLIFGKSPCNTGGGGGRWWRLLDKEFRSKNTC